VPVIRAVHGAIDRGASPVCSTTPRRFSLSTTTSLGLRPAGACSSRRPASAARQAAGRLGFPGHSITRARSRPGAPPSAFRWGGLARRYMREGQSPETTPFPVAWIHAPRALDPPHPLKPSPPRLGYPPLIFPFPPAAWMPSLSASSPHWCRRNRHRGGPGRRPCGRPPKPGPGRGASEAVIPRLNGHVSNVSPGKTRGTLCAAPLGSLRTTR